LGVARIEVITSFDMNLDGTLDTRQDSHPKKSAQTICIWERLFFHTHAFSQIAKTAISVSSRWFFLPIGSKRRSRPSSAFVSAAIWALIEFEQFEILQGATLRLT